MTPVTLKVLATWSKFYSVVFAWVKTTHVRAAHFTESPPFGICYQEFQSVTSRRSVGYLSRASSDFPDALCSLGVRWRASILHWLAATLTRSTFSRVKRKDSSFCNGLQENRALSCYCGQLLYSLHLSESWSLWSYWTTTSQTPKCSSDSVDSSYAFV